MNQLYELPLGMKYALAENRAALDYFVSLSPIAKVQLINHAETLHSQGEMTAFVSTFSDSNRG